MSVNYDVLGLIFASMHDAYVPELTKQRTMGSIPFGGRYRLIDFPLSSFVNSGISEVGVITKANYGSLLDHLGSGRDWDLSRKKGGLHLLPPYSQLGGKYKGRLDALSNIWGYVEHSNANYVILSNADVVATVDYTSVLKQHKSTEADITLVYSEGHYDSNKNMCSTIVEFDENNILSSALIHPPASGVCKMWLETMIISKNVLNEIVFSAASKGIYSFTRGILQSKDHNYKIMGYEHKGIFMHIDSMQSYFEANMMLLDSEKRRALFKKDVPIFTKVGDNAPVKYGIEAVVNDSLIADGCVIEGTVENSILFRGVRVGKDSIVRNCILMQGTKVGINCNINAMITDKNVIVSDESVRTSPAMSPLYIGKNGRV